MDIKKNPKNNKQSKTSARLQREFAKKKIASHKQKPRPELARAIAVQNEYEVFTENKTTKPTKLRARMARHYGRLIAAL